MGVKYTHCFQESMRFFMVRVHQNRRGLYELMTIFCCVRVVIRATHPDRSELPVKWGMVEFETGWKTDIATGT